MPLPDLLPDLASGRRNQAGFFAELHLVSPKHLENRTAVLSIAAGREPVLAAVGAS